jgi:competence protein ComEC
MTTEKSANFSNFPLLWLAFFFAAGILLTRVVVLPSFLLLTVLLTTALAAFFELRRQKLGRATVFVFCAFAASGALLAGAKTKAADSIARIYDGGQINFKTVLRLTATLVGEPEAAPNGYFLLVRAEKIEFGETAQTASGRVRLFLPVEDKSRQAFENLDLHYAAKISVLAKLTRENRFRNLGAADFRQILANQNLDAVGSIKSIENLQKLENGANFSFFNLIYVWRARLIESFRRNFSVSTAGVLAASLLNNRYFLDKTTADNFREGGTFHVLVISGVHITFIGFLFAWLIRRFTENTIWQFAAANFLLWSYAFAVGAETPVMRAAIMFSIFHAAQIFFRNSVSLNSFGASVLILLFYQPSTLFDQSFLLTIFSVAAIVGAAFPILEKMRQIGAWQISENTPAPPACSKWLKSFCEILFWRESNWQQKQRHSVWRARLFKSETAKYFEKINLQPVLQFVFGAVFISLAVTIWLLPLTANFFHRLSLISILLNVFVGSLIAIVSFLAIGTILIAFVSPFLAQPFAALTEVFNYLLVFSSEPFVQTGTASLRLPVYGGEAALIYWIYYLPVIWLTVAANRWKPFELKTKRSRLQVPILFAFYILITVLVIFHPFSAFSTGGKLRIDFLDVGQGDSALITTPHNVKILIDGGGRLNYRAKNADSETIFVPDARSIGESVVCEFLWQKGFDTVDFLLPTHADADHINGLNDVARNFKIESALVARTPNNNGEYKQFAEILQKRRIPIVKISRGQVFEIDGVKIEILSPESDDNPNAVWDNNQSVVFRLTYGSRRFLFTGDIEAQTEKILVRQQPESLACDVIKVAHHGSKSSSTKDFIRAAQAKFAIISVGRESQFGHPHAQTLENWNVASAKILTTGENGTISFTTDGTNLELETFCQQLRLFGCL